MNNIITIFRRELASYFNSPIAYIFLIVFAVVASLSHMFMFFALERAEMRTFFSILPFILAIFIPAITMRQWAEDRKSGTLELLLTFPMPTVHVVLGKFFASFLFYIIALLTTLPLVIILRMLGNPDMGPIWGGYFGCLLVGAFYISLGLLISGFARDQIVAFVVALVVSYALFVLGWPYVASLVDGWTGRWQLGSSVLRFVALTAHYETAQRGLIDIRDILYFLVMTVLCLGLNALFLEGRSRKGYSSRFAINTAVFVALAIFVNVVVSGFSGGRYDLTEGKIYTVSPEARQVLSRLSVPVHVSYYVSPPDKMPTVMKTFESEVRDLLQELRIASGGNLRFSIHHVDALDALSVSRRMERERITQQFGEEAAIQLIGADDTTEQTPGEKQAEALMRKGIAPFNLQTIQADERSTVSVYSGMALAYKEREEEAIPQVVPQNFGDLEYEILSRVMRLMQDEDKKVVLVAPKDELDPQTRQMLQQQGMEAPPPTDNYSTLGQILRHEKYQFERIDMVEKNSIPDDADTVVILEPRNFQDRQLWEINRALHSGKSVILGVQNYTMNYSPGARGISATVNKIDSGLESLLEQYGLGVNSDFLMDMQSEQLNISSGQSFGPFAMSTPVRLPMHIMLTEQSTNPDVAITGNLSRIFYLWGSMLRPNYDKIEELGLRATTLLHSGPTSWTAPFKTGQIEANDITPPSQYQSPQPLAMLIEGQFPDVYEGQERPAWPKPPSMPGQPPVEDDDEYEPPPEPTTPKPGKLLLVAGSMLWHNNFLQSGGNFPFFLNSVEGLTLGDELLHVRTKQQISRMLRKTSRGERAWYWFIAVGLVPLLLTVIGIVRLVMRRRTKEAYLRYLQEVAKTS